MAMSAAVSTSLRGICKRVAAGSVRGFHPSTSVIADPLQLDVDYGKEKIAFPRNKTEKGLHYELNWSLCAKGVAPNAYAFRNLDDKGLIMRSGAKLTKQKSLVVTEDAASVLDQANDAAETAHVMNAVKDELSNVVDVFVHDGALASHSSVESRVRLVTDSPELALAMKNMLVRVPLKEDPREQKTDVTVYVATGVRPSENNAIFSSECNSDGGLEIAFAGLPSFSALLGVVENASREQLSQQNALPVRCSTYVASDGTSSLVFSDDSSAPVAPVEGSSLFGAHSNVWGESGVMRTFAGAVFDSAVPTGHGSVVLSPKKGAPSVQQVSVAANIISHPTTVVFLSSKIGKTGPVKDMKKARAWFEAAGHSAEDAAIFEAKLKEHGVRVVGAKKPADVSKAMSG